MALVDALFHPAKGVSEVNGASKKNTLGIHQAHFVGPFQGGYKRLGKPPDRLVYTPFVLTEKCFYGSNTLILGNFVELGLWHGKNDRVEGAQEIGFRPMPVVHNGNGALLERALMNKLVIEIEFAALLRAQLNKN